MYIDGEGYLRKDGGVSPGRPRAWRDPGRRGVNPRPLEESKAFSEEKMSRWGVLNAVGGSKSASGLMLPMGVLNLMPLSLSGEKTPLSMSGGAARFLSGENEDGRAKLGGVLPRLGVTKFKSGERERASMSTSRKMFFIGLRKEESRRLRFTSCSLESAFELDDLPRFAVLVSSWGRCATLFNCLSCRGLWTEIPDIFFRLGVGRNSKLDSGSVLSDTHSSIKLASDWTDTGLA